jgi:CubicO group peptidase (beta-lactamase class C family)
MMPKHFPSVIVALLCTAGAAFAQEPRLPEVDAVVRPALDIEAPGLGVLVMKGGKVLHMRGYGTVDTTSDAPVDADSLFDLASVSKEMTALAAMMQIEEGLYEESTPIADLLPVFADTEFDGRDVTVGDLIHHLSGLTSYLAGDESLDYTAETTNAQVLEWLAQQPQDHPAGQRFDYSNSGYVTLGSLVAAADEADSLAEVLHARIWDELGMESTALVTPADPDRVVTGYAGRDGDFEVSYEPTVTEGDGNVFTSLRDLALYERALVDHTLLSEDATRSLFTNGTYDNGKPVKDEGGAGYAYGWSIESYDGDTYASHSGSWMGTATYYQRNLTTGVTVIVLANGEDADVAGLAEAIEDALP